MAEVGSSRAAGALQQFQGVAELISDLQTENRALRQRVDVLGVEVNVITKWIADTIGLELFNRSSDLYKDTHPDDDESVDIKNKLTMNTTEAASANANDDGNLEDGNEAPNLEVDGEVPNTREAPIVGLQSGNVSGHSVRPDPMITNVVIELRRLEDDPATNAQLLRSKTQSCKNSAKAKVTSTSKRSMQPKTFKVHICRFCQKKFHQSYNLKRHEKIHTGEKPFKCPLCDKAFVEKDDQIRHLGTHTREKPYGCSLCGQTFTAACSLKIHQILHTGQKKYKCTYCNSRFVRKGERVTHERVHTGEKPYTCRYCGQKFRQSGARTLHEMIHTGKKPHECQQCPKRFRRSRDLKRHISKTHPASSP